MGHIRGKYQAGTGFWRSKVGIVTAATTALTAVSVVALLGTPGSLVGISAQAAPGSNPGAGSSSGLGSTLPSAVGSTVGALTRAGASTTTVPATPTTTTLPVAPTTTLVPVPPTSVAPTTTLTIPISLPPPTVTPPASRVTRPTVPTTTIPTIPVLSPTTSTPPAAGRRHGIQTEATNTTTTRPPSKATRNTAPGNSASANSASGKSASGKSASGKSASGKSVSPTSSTAMPPTSNATMKTPEVTPNASSAPAPVAPTTPSNCTGNAGGQLTSYLASLPAGSTFYGSGCYLVPDGITITRPITIDGGTYEDLATGATEGPGQRSRVQPIIHIVDTQDVTIENVNLVGAHTDTSFHRNLVGQAGIDMLSSSQVAISNVAISDTYGDGLTFGFQPRYPPNTNIQVNGLTISNAGRQGVTMAYVTESTLNHVTVASATEESWDFESDIPNIGSGNITLNDPVWTQGFRVVESLSGPITVNNANGSKHITLMNDAAASGQSVTFNGGTVVLRTNDHGTPPAGIYVTGGSMTFNGTTIDAMATKQQARGRAWVVIDGGRLAFNHSTIAAPVGTNDARSTVTVSQ
jgi:hypothetical protein